MNKDIGEEPRQPSDLMVIALVRLFFKIGRDVIYGNKIIDKSEETF